jgi:dipeptide/tripeptide permease
MAVFGADQIQESKITSRYFEKYYIAVNIGATIATLSIPLIQGGTDGLTDPNNYFYGYVIAIVMLVGAAVLFIVGRQYYIHIPPSDSVTMTCIPVVINAFQSWRKYHNDRQTTNSNRRDSILRSFWKNQNTISHEEMTINDDVPHSFLDYAKAAYNGKYSDRQVDDVKSLRQAIVVFLLLIPYWIIYYQV